MTTATLLAGSLVLATGCATSPPAARPLPQTPAEHVVTPVTTAPSKAPEPVKPTGDAINVHKVRWTKATAVARGKQVRLTWWSGVEPCTVLDKVKVKETAKKVTITLYEGTSPKAKDVSCIMLALEKTTTVKLKHALGKRKLVDGAKP
ncbi:hypothetical protein ACIBK9_02690 [Nonomuraea sp. NPDC050227]|uniref:hypothetical protein n=1 Tax=Nonomuraea sp. NPDC050227 TaxID=3364360 RepID=UPI003799EEC2